MYTVDTDIKDLKVKDRVITKLFFSMNAPQIATPELGTEEARCYIMLFKEGNSYSSYIGLFLPSSDRRFFYTYSENPLAEDRLNEVMEESNQFAEEMGFLLDELKLSVMSVDERNKWIEEQPFFGYTLKQEEKPKEAPGETEEGKPVEAAATQWEKPVEQPVIGEWKPPAPPEQPAPAVDLKQVPFPVSPPEPAQETSSPAPMLDVAMDSPVEGPPVEEPALPAQPASKRASGRQKSLRTPPSAPVEVDSAEKDVDETQPANQRDTSVRTQKRQKKGQNSSTGTVAKEYEALARLLASF